MPLLMFLYQVLIYHFVIIVCFLAFRDKAHAFNYLVKGDECILLLVNSKNLWKLTGSNKIVYRHEEMQDLQREESFVLQRANNEM